MVSNYMDDYYKINEPKLIHYLKDLKSNIGLILYL